MDNRTIGVFSIPLFCVILDVLTGLLILGVEPSHWTYKDHMRTDTLYEHVYRDHGNVNMCQHKNRAYGELSCDSFPPLYTVQGCKHVVGKNMNKSR